MTHILVAVDFSVCSHRAFAYAATLAHGAHARLTVLHVVPYFPDVSEGPGVVAAPSTDPERWKALHAELRELARSGRPRGGHRAP